MSRNHILAARPDYTTQEASRCHKIIKTSTRQTTRAMRQTDRQTIKQTRQQDNKGEKMKHETEGMNDHITCTYQHLDKHYVSL